MYLAITIDTECDKGKGWSVQQPMAFRNIHEGVKTYLQPLFDQYNIRPTYLLSPEIIKDTASALYFKSISGKAELGTHLHSEFIEPNCNMRSEYSKTFQNELNPETEFEKLKNLTSLFTNTFGYQPLSFRAGRFAISRHTLDYLSQLGYRVDSSVTPDTWWMRNGKHGTNFLGAPYQPYFPDQHDFRKPGNMNILEVPVTIFNTKLLNIPMGLKRTLNPLRKWQRLILTKTIQPGGNLKWFRPTYSNAEEMLNLVKLVASSRSFKSSNHQIINSSTILVMMFHSNEFTLGTSPYNLNENTLNKIKTNLKNILSELKTSNTHSVTLSETVKFITK